MNKNEAALKIQRFWQKRKVYQNLSGANNYDYYLTLLACGNKNDTYNLLARMTFGRVITTPKNGFPFLKQRNPFLGINPEYHRLDVLGSNLTDIILKQWGKERDADSTYIPVVNAGLGTIHDALNALQWREGKDYQLVESQTTSRLKFIKIRKTYDDCHFTNTNRWGILSSLGLIASPLLLSTIAIADGYLPDNFLNTIASLNGKWRLDGAVFENFSENFSLTSQVATTSLQRQPKTIEQLKKSILIKKLNQLKEQSSGSSLLANGLSSMIADLPLDVEAPDIIARLSLFLETALFMDRDDHAFFANFIQPIIHEISLLLIKHLHNKPYINFTEFQSINYNDMSPWVGLNNSDYDFVAFPAQSGMHANVIASTFARDICQKPDKTLPTIRLAGHEYWEVADNTRSFSSFGRVVSTDNADIVRLCAGPIGDYSNGTYPAVDINKLIRSEVKKNKQLQTIIIDITSASYQHLKLDSDVKLLLEKQNISLIFWESTQKFGQLHTDHIQYGRVFAFCNKKDATRAPIESYKKSATQDMLFPDVQIGAFINKHCQKIMPMIREKHFKNGLILRKILLGDETQGVNKPSYYEIRVNGNQNPFVSLNGNLSTEKLQKIIRVFEKMQLQRDSFGHRYTTEEKNGARISAGAEHEVDATILATSLKYYIDLDPDTLYKKIIDQSLSLDIRNQAQLIDYLSLIKAWSFLPHNSYPITLLMAKQFRTLIEHDNEISRNTLNGTRQFVSDLYAIFKERSPFKKMQFEAFSTHNPFAVALFTSLDNTYQKTGRIDIDDAIKHALRITNNIPYHTKIDEISIKSYKQKLFSGEYSQEAARFFFKSLEFENNMFLAIDEYLISPSDKRAKKISLLYQKLEIEVTKEAELNKLDCKLHFEYKIQQMCNEAASCSMRAVSYNQFKISNEQKLLLSKVVGEKCHFVFSTCNDKEALIYDHTGKLYSKATELANNGHPYVAGIIMNCCLQIKTALTLPNEEERYRKIYDVLVKTKNNPSIQKHRGTLKTSLVNLLIIVSGVGALYLLATSGARGSFFYRPNTDTENKLEEFEEDIFGSEPTT